MNRHLQTSPLTHRTFTKIHVVFCWVFFFAFLNTLCAADMIGYNPHPLARPVFEFLTGVFWPVFLKHQELPLDIYHLRLSNTLWGGNWTSKTYRKDLLTIRIWIKSSGNYLIEYLDVKMLKGISVLPMKCFTLIACVETCHKPCDLNDE